MMSALLRCVAKRSWERLSGILSPLALRDMILTGGIAVSDFGVTIVFAKLCDLQSTKKEIYQELWQEGV